ncbi:hypothetical protein [Actinomadura sp. 7K507]|uniref:hypothetical protein n=1 Tax=Actinomadura sp. 7K507 TaxID=2530365 RepID=UPI0010506C39|nr:hypothetical protein [Actinomadura sp. 7K507]TDC90336.1 hypothetical protein E1285_14910 [Actinomadura sp. 7K507]
MTSEDTQPDLPAIPPEPEPSEFSESEEAREPRLRPRERRILQAIAVLCVVPLLLSVQWVDESNSVEKNLKPPEKVTTVQPGAIGELAGAKWKIMKRAAAQPLAIGGQQDSSGVTELRLSVGFRPENAAAAKAVGSGFAYRLVDDEGREWSATGTADGKAQVGVAMMVTITAKVPRSKADSLELEIEAPKTSRKKGDPLASLRFEH